MKMVAEKNIWVDGNAIEPGEVFEIHNDKDIKVFMSDSIAFPVDHSFDVLEHDQVVRKKK